MKKTYFLSWETDNKNGHSIYEFNKDVTGRDITPRDALKYMLENVEAELEKDSIGFVRAKQFNSVI